MTIELAGCLIVQDRKLLVIHRNTPTRKRWEIIGGKREPSELSADTAEREAREEAAIAVKAIKRVYTYDFEEDGQHFSQDLWWSVIEGGNPQTREPKHDALEWLSVRELTHREDRSPALAYLVKNIVDGEVSI